MQAEDGIRGLTVTGVQTCALPISSGRSSRLYEAIVRQKQLSSGVGAGSSQLRGTGHFRFNATLLPGKVRSEERRVGKEWRSGCMAKDKKKEFANLQLQTFDSALQC